ncbi:MAG TPA: rhodanese-like domain-containing protein [Gammaproteobacteria bacterium]|nr:rhodanese-like domain-containing protein [Gammaproteobacteria bacterium]
MKRPFVTATLAATLALAAIPTVALAQTAAAQRSPSQARVLTRAELDALLAKPAEVLLIDVRRPDELASIGGFPAYLSIQAADLENNLGAIPRDRTLVIVSNHAGRAGRAADLLKSRGFKVAGAVGAQDYEQQGGTLVKPRPPERAP